MKSILMLVIALLGFAKCRELPVADISISVSGDETPLSKPRAISELPELLKSDAGIQELYDEFESVTGGKRRSWDEATKPENIEKNRYQDELMAFDHSRVELNTLPDDPNSDYINANYFDGVNSQREYIATQGPLPNTINDFWRMIVQQNVTRIIMLANLLEHNQTKVSKYWPEHKDIFGDYEITKLRELHIPELEHVIRKFSVKRPGIESPLIVRHFHFTGWPDFGVPASRLQIVSLANQARQSDPDNKAPIVVHCSAGIGRTGTTILTDYMMQNVKKQKAAGVEDPMVDVLNRLDHMRTIRPDVVEKKEQYQFVHEAINDVFNNEETKEELQDIEENYKTCF